MTDGNIQETEVNHLNATRNKLARRAGAVYLTYIVFIASFGLLQSHQIAWNNLAATARNIQQSQMFFRVSFVIEIVATLLFLCATWSYYALLKPVGKNLALLLVLLNLTGVAVEAASAAVRFGALKCLTDTDLAHGFTTDQMQAMAMLLLRVGGSGMVVANLFYGAWLFPFGVLVWKSGFIPRFWGGLLIADCFCLWICFAQSCLYPAYEKWTYPLYPIMFVAEVGTAVWLVIKGASVKPQPSTP
ncbi:MAG: DUF4386 domain-containing protein [Terracidiphilus sp.]